MGEVHPGIYHPSTMGEVHPGIYTPYVHPGIYTPYVHTLVYPPPWVHPCTPTHPARHVSVLSVLAVAGEGSPGLKPVINNGERGSRRASEP